MTLTEALRCFTLDAAYAGHQEKSIGSLEAGKQADFILIDRDMFTIPAQDIHNIGVLQTWVAGRKVYQKPAAVAAVEEPVSRQADSAVRMGMRTCVPPEYPKAAQYAEAQGTVVLSFLIGTDGTVRDSKIKRSTGNVDLDEAARTSLQTCQFKPAVVAGKPVEAWTDLSYVWSLQ